MFFTECAILAERHPNLATAIQKIDAQLRKMRTAEVIRVDDFASFLRLDSNQVNAVLEHLAETGFLRSEEMIECAHCGMAVLQSDYDEALDEDDEYRCTSCDRLWKDTRVKSFATYRSGEKWPEITSDSSGDKVVEQFIQPTENLTAEVSSRAYCQIITHEGLNQLSKSQYERLASGRKTYDIFIDGFTKEVLQKGKAHSKLTAAEFEIISEYIESKRPMRPFSTKTGSARSRDAAIKLIENARRKVDIRLSRYKYLAFQLQKVTDPKMKSFLFAPPKDMTYCLVIPSTL